MSSEYSAAELRWLAEQEGKPHQPTIDELQDRIEELEDDISALFKVVTAAERVIDDGEGLDNMVALENAVEEWQMRSEANES